MKVLLFWFLQAQTFYKKLHEDALVSAHVKTSNLKEEWADIGCGVGLMSTLANEKAYKVNSFDLDPQMITFAKFLHKDKPQLTFEVQDVMKLTHSYDVISATSLLSVVPQRKEVLTKLISLLKTQDSKLILIEPTKEMSVKNVYKLIHSPLDLWRYKMLFVWANARQGKEVSKEIFKDIKNISHHYFLNEMVRVSVLKKT